MDVTSASRCVTSAYTLDEHLRSYSTVLAKEVPIQRLPIVYFVYEKIEGAVENNCFISLSEF